MKNREYRNPVITGFHPDPSVVRVGEDYYLANSTFQYFPSIVISHSRDLVHWEIIGHAITDSSYLDLSDFHDSYGIWAPDISYHNGTFYIFATLRMNDPVEGDACGPLRRQMILKSSRPEGPYSKPVFIDVDGIDPSHFVDDDGRHYLVVSPLKIVPLDNDCTRALSDPVVAWKGTGRRSPEGPHIFKKGTYYYAILAEGGTGYGHCVTVGRSKNLYGPYEASPYNPVLTQSDPEAKIQRSGHGSLVETQNGEWWMTYLCGRPNEGRYCTLGRETALDPVRWTEDGWFVVNDRKGPSEIQHAPDLPESPADIPYFDDFDSPRLDVNWEFVRNPAEGDWSLTQRPGYYRIWTGDCGLDDIHAKNTLVRREKHHGYTATAKLEFAPDRDGQEAGIVCYYSTNTYAKLGVVRDGGMKIRLTRRSGNAAETVGERAWQGKNVVYLRVTVCQQRREFDCSEDNIHWTGVGVIENASFLSDEGVDERKRFTGTMVGMYANSGGRSGRVCADFDWFDYSGGPRSSAAPV